MPTLTNLKPKLATMNVSPLAKTGATPQVDRWGSGRGGRPWRRTCDRIKERDLHTCQACGLVTLQLEVDHIINIAQGGSDDDANLQALCVPCHRSKTAREAGQGRG